MEHKRYVLILKKVDGTDVRIPSEDRDAMSEEQLQGLTATIMMKGMPDDVDTIEVVEVTEDGDVPVREVTNKEVEEENA